MSAPSKTLVTVNARFPWLPQKELGMRKSLRVRFTEHQCKREGASYSTARS
jgi:hypothetical protein